MARGCDGAEVADDCSKKEKEVKRTERDTCCALILSSDIMVSESDSGVEGPCGVKRGRTVAPAGSSASRGSSTPKTREVSWLKKKK